MVGPMGPCILGRDKLKRPKKWADWLREAENKMRFGGITEGGRKWDFLRSCAGAELTELWDKEVRVVYEATGEGPNSRVFQLWKDVSDHICQLGNYVVHNFQLDAKKIRI